VDNVRDPQAQGSAALGGPGAGRASSKSGLQIMVPSEIEEYITSSIDQASRISE